MDAKTQGNLVHAAVFIALILALSFVVVHFNVVSCSFYSSVGCDIYYSLVAGGKPKILIVQGNEGMGDPEFLYNTLRSPRFSARVSIRDLDVVSLPVLLDYQLVIVEKARKMGIDEIRMFQDYAVRGGRLVWIGDAGTQGISGESDVNYFLKGNQRAASGKDEYLGPWARRSGDRQVSLDYTLGVQYKGNYCEIAKCVQGTEPEYTGNFDFVDREHKLVFGLGQNLPFYGDFSIVGLSGGARQNSAAYIDFGSGLIGTPPQEYFWLKNERQNLGNEFPVVVSSGVGEKVAYYAFPPEFFVSEKMPLDERTGERIAYWALLENMYYGMLYK